MSEFWIVTGAAAPIIALANLVAADEGMTSFYTFQKTRKNKRLDQDDKDTINRGFRLAFWIVLLCVINILAQTIVLFQALLFLQTPSGNSPFAFHPFILATVAYGIPVSGVTTMLTGRLKARCEDLKDIQQRLKDSGPGSATARAMVQTGLKPSS